MTGYIGNVTDDDLGAIMRTTRDNVWARQPVAVLSRDGRSAPPPDPATVCCVRTGRILPWPLASGAALLVAAAAVTPGDRIDYVVGGIVSTHAEVHVDLATGQVASGSARPGATDIAFDRRTASAADIAALRRMVAALAPGEIDRDTCPPPPDPRTGVARVRPPIADAIRSLTVTVAGRATGGLIPVDACPTPRVARLLAAVQQLARHGSP